MEQNRYTTMEITFLILVLFVLPGNSQTPCPTGCVCQSPFTVSCSAGFTAFPSPLTDTIKLLSINGNYMTHNSIPTIHRSDFQPMPGLVSLQMAYCEINTIADDTFLSRASLTYLDLSYNNIPRITDKTFLGLTNLVSLQISGNPHCELSEKTFDSLSNLEELYIAEMDLERLLPVMFTNLKHLRLLDVHGNKIWKIEFDFGAVFPNLQHLDLSRNLLKGLSKRYNDTFSHLTTVKMSGNPLQCNCELRWLKHSTKKALDPEYASDALVCYGPERLKYAPILRVPDLEFKCVAPQIVNCTTETYVVMETSSLRMWCELGGDPYPDVTWTRYDGKNVEFTYENTSNYYVSRTGSLDIFNVSQADDGTWTLGVSNSIGQKSHQLKIVVTPKTTTTTTTSTTTTTTTTTTTSPTTTTTTSTTTPTPTTSTTTPTATTTTSTTTPTTSTPTTSTPTTTTSTTPPQTTPTTSTLKSTTANTILSSSEYQSANGGTVTHKAPDHVNPNPTNIPPDDNDKTDDDSDEVKPTNRADEDGGGMNMMMIAGAGGGGLLLIVLIAVIVYCVKRKKGSNRVEDISIRQDNDFDSVRSPRRHRVNDF
ncbi:leucine-rich repeat and fibronectin type III domain-containing protein 1-like protein [Mizuhopecten yessoensis]|uniref:leucine-rich repeat and fibronectin type III domain-containing protein 1-like protein n=1 Tax=Mizuhopecten yessoensis TaxID=6573 RepID=UPI000B45A2B7|nr:leucine-rich repeat and fibronectin type III domain-containing protein 1-like protein [Mizuhopecten yessoensis]